MSLLDPKWKYTPSTATDIRKRFEKERRALAKRLAQAQYPSSDLRVITPEEFQRIAAAFGIDRDRRLRIVKGEE